MTFTLRKIEKKEIDTEEELEAERLRHAPVLGLDAWYACFWWTFWRMLTTQVMTRAGLWAIVSTVVAYEYLNKVIESPFPKEGTLTISLALGGHCALAWIWYCAPQQAKLIMEAMAARVRGEQPISPSGESK